MSQMELESASADETKSMASALGRALRPGDVVSLVGDLGVGKTNFVQGAAKALGIGEPVTSPTFNLVFEYRKADLPLFHFDFYRIEDEADLCDIDFYSLTDSTSGGASFVEWADKFPDAMPEDILELEILRRGGTSRLIKASSKGPRSDRLLLEWMANL